MYIDIIGAGIGGLTTAIALEQKGFKIRIFEQTETIKEVGAGILLANNAMQIYKKLGLKSVIEKNGYPISTMNITKSNLTPINKIDLTFFENKYQTKNISIHRGILQKILIDKLNATEIFLNHKLSSVDKTKNEYTLKFENGKQINSSVILAADGINSVVRQNIFPENRIRTVNQICWRAVINFNLSDQYKNEVNEIWDKSGRFGFVQISENKVYWYAVKTFKKNKDELITNKLDQYFTHFDPLVKKLIQSTNKINIHSTTISDLKPTSLWFKNNICLLGDAAHATTPNMGQGACQAIEDAYVLAECLHKYQNVSQAFAAYHKLRLTKAHQIVKTSWFIGKIAHVSNPILVNFRNQILKYTPDYFTKKQNEAIFKLAL